MKICFYGSESDHRFFIEQLSTSHKYAGWLRKCDLCNNYDHFVDLLRTSDYDIAFVTQDNADGMEGVIAVRNISPDLPVIWFSNDKGFGCQAYRLNTDFFHAKPLTAKSLEMALDCLPCGR